MGEKEKCSNGVRLWQVAGGAVLVVGLVALARAVPDIVRIMKMRAM